MNEIDKIRLNDIGTIFRIRILDNDEPVDLSGTTVKTIKFRKPDKTVVEKSAEFYTDGTDGYIQYTAVSGDIDVSGVWHIQAYIKFADQEWHTTLDSFMVSKNIS